MQDVQKLVKKAKPEWEKVIEQNSGAAGPAYSTQIVLPDGDIALDVVVTAYTEFGGNPPSYQQCLWQLVVAEGDAIRANYMDNGVHPSPVPKAAQSRA